MGKAEMTMPTEGPRIKLTVYCEVISSQLVPASDLIYSDLFRTDDKKNTFPAPVLRQVNLLDLEGD